MTKIIHGGTVVVFNGDGVRLGSFPDPANAVAWMRWQIDHNEKPLRLWWVDTTTNPEAEKYLQPT